jgi:hypothetical protein
MINRSERDSTYPNKQRTRVRCRRRAPPRLLTARRASPVVSHCTMNDCEITFFEKGSDEPIILFDSDSL